MNKRTRRRETLLNILLRNRKSTDKKFLFLLLLKINRDEKWFLHEELFPSEPLQCPLLKNLKMKSSPTVSIKSKTFWSISNYSATPLRSNLARQGSVEVISDVEMTFSSSSLNRKITRTKAKKPLIRLDTNIHQPSKSDNLGPWQQWFRSVAS